MNGMYLLHALTPLHPGTGQGHGLIDLPVAREQATTHPLVPGSSVKGVLRAACREDDSAGETPDSLTWRLFGPAPEKAELYPSALRFSDARLLLLPVRCDRGTFAWVTCRFVLERIRRDLEGRDIPKAPLPKVKENQARVATDDVLNEGPTVGLGDLTLEMAGAGGVVKTWADVLSNLIFPKSDRDSHFDAWNTMLRERLCLVHDDTFTWLAENHTEVRARIRLDPDTGTVKQGGLWYEESLPAETVLVGLVQSVDNGHVKSSEARKTLERLAGRPLQVGGHASTGSGAVRLCLSAPQGGGGR